MYSVCTLLKVVGYYDLSVLSMSVMGFQKKVRMGGGWVGEPYPFFFLIFGIYLTLQSPLVRIIRTAVETYVHMEVHVCINTYMSSGEKVVTYIKLSS